MLPVVPINQQQQKKEAAKLMAAVIAEGAQNSAKASDILIPGQKLYTEGDCDGEGHPETKCGRIEAK